MKTPIEFDTSSCGRCITPTHHEERMYKDSRDVATTYKLIAEFGGMITAKVAFTEQAGISIGDICNFTKRRWESFISIR